MPKHKPTSSTTNSYSRYSPFSDIASKSSKINTPPTNISEEACTLRHRALLAEARARSSQGVQPLQPVSSHKYRGKGFTLRYRMELVEIYRFLCQENDGDVTPSNFHKFVKANIHRESIKQWDKDYDKIKFDVLHGRGDKCTLSSDQSALIRSFVGKAVYDWLVEMRKDNGIISDRQLQPTTDTILHVLVDDNDPEHISLGRPISFTATWRAEMKKEYCVASFNLKGESGFVDMEAIEPRMAEIRRICSEYDPEDIYNCDETGMYLLELPTHSYSIPELNRGAKATRGGGHRVSIIFCINATGSSLAQEVDMPALRPFVIAEHLARGISQCQQVPITSKKHVKGYMTQQLFLEWLHSLDVSLSKPSLLLFDSCGAHNGIDDIDALTGEKWRHLRLERLPPNSTSVTQPLDAGTISVFKRRYVEMLSNKAIVTEYASGKKVSNGEAWSLIPYAWSQVKASTLRQCFRSTKVLPKTMADELEERSMNVQERQPVYPPVVTTDKQQTNQHFLRFIASTLDGHKFDFTLDKNQTDAQDLAEEIKNAVRKEPAMRTALCESRDKSSSVDSDELASFKAKFGQDKLAIELEEWLSSEDTKARAAAQLIIHCSLQTLI